MTRIDFYLSRGSGRTDKELAVCKLSNKAFRLGHQVYILTCSPEESAQLDRLLWTFSAGSFIPHGLIATGSEAKLPVVIGDDEPPENWHDVLISLTAAVPSCFSRFERVADVVSSTEEARERARERFRFYRERGYPLQTHDL